jgi:dihydroorotase
MLTEESLLTRDADYRMNPPLREESDRLAIIDGICDGTIDCIVTDHAPHSPEEKSEFMTAPNGVVGLETSLSAVLTGLYHTGKITLETIVRLMALNPRKILSLPYYGLKAGRTADITIVDTECEWTVNTENFKSKGRNSAFKNMTFDGKPVAVISKGILRYSEINLH